MAYASAVLLQAGVPRIAAYAAAGLTLLSPRNANMAIVVWKDVPYSACLLLLTALLVSLALQARPRAPLRGLVAAGLLLAALPLLRHNAPTILIGLPPLLLALFRPRRGPLLATAVAALAFVAVKWGAIPALDVKPMSDTGHWYDAHRIASLLTEDAPLVDDELRFLARIRPLADGWTYTPLSVIPVIARPHCDAELAQAHRRQLRELSWSLASRYPFLVLRHVFRVGSYLIVPSSAGWFATLTISPNAHGLAIKPPWPAGHRVLTEVIVRSASPCSAWLLGRTAVHLYLCLLAMLFLLWRTRDVRLGFAYLPVLLNTAGLFLAGQGHDVRYHFPVALCAGILVLLGAFPPVAGRARARGRKPPPGAEGEPPRRSGSPDIPLALEAAAP